jgi:hypothetical protein
MTSARERRYECLEDLMRVQRMIWSCIVERKSAMNAPEVLMEGSSRV